MAGELQLLQSDAVLERVVKSQSLETRWARTDANAHKLTTGEAIALLRSRLKVNVPPSFNVIQLRVKSDEADEATRLAKEIVDAYIAVTIATAQDRRPGSSDRAAMAEERRRERERPRQFPAVMNVTVLERPTPGDRLARPYIPGCLLLGGAGGLFLALVLGIAVTTLAKSRAPAKPEESPSASANAAA